MDLYTAVSYASSRQLTLRYSTSFGVSSRLFSKPIQPHIYAIYGLVRIADEIVDTYRGPDASSRLDDLEHATRTAIKTGFDANPIIHAFASTARAYSINDEIISPFFASMRMDLSPHTYHPNQYADYIYGSAEVVGLMCLRVFCNGDQTRYDHLRDGAQALGAAYQKINFLRDLASDYKELGRLYFPGFTFESFDESAKKAVVIDIQSDLARARPALTTLPRSSRTAVVTSYAYYAELLRRLDNASVQTIKNQRIRVPSHHKLQLLVKTVAKDTFTS